VRTNWLLVGALLSYSHVLFSFRAQPVTQLSA
jgi:hypothetical protein